MKTITDGKTLKSYIKDFEVQFSKNFCDYLRRKGLYRFLIKKEVAFSTFSNTLFITYVFLNPVNKIPFFWKKNFLKECHLFFCKNAGVSRSYGNKIIFTFNMI